MINKNAQYNNDLNRSRHNKKKIDYYKRAIMIFFIISTIIIIFFLIFKKINFPDINFIREFIQSMGFFAPLVFILIMIVAIIISPIPSLPLTIVSGLIWGPYLGTLYSVTGALIGAIISFSIARKIGRATVEKMLRQDINFCNIWTDNKMFWIVLFARLFPFFQFDIVSYGAGITKMSYSQFAMATLIGMTPTTYIFVRFGNFLVVPSWTGIVLSLMLIAGIFAVPMLIKRRASLRKIL